MYQVLLSLALQSINKFFLLPEAICCCLQTCNVAASEEIVGERCVPNLIVINSTINQLESKVSLITTRCLRVFVVVYRVETLQHQRQWWVTHMYQVLLSLALPLTS